MDDVARVSNDAETHDQSSFSFSSEASHFMRIRPISGDLDGSDRAADSQACLRERGHDGFKCEVERRALQRSFCANVGNIADVRSCGKKITVR